jgi:chromosome segregation ATPase
VAELKARVAELTGEASQARAELEVERTEHEQRTRELEGQLAAAARTAEELAEENRVVAGRVQHDLEQLREHAADQELQLLVRLDEALGARDDVERLLQASQAERERLADEIEALEIDRALQLASAPAPEDVERTERQLADLRRARAALCDELVDARTRAEAAEAQTVESRAALDETTARLEELRAAALERDEEFETTMAAARERVAYLEARLVELNTRLQVGESTLA